MARRPPPKVPAQREPSGPSANTWTFSFGRSLVSGVKAVQIGTGSDDAGWEYAAQPMATTEKQPQRS